MAYCCKCKKYLATPDEHVFSGYGYMLIFCGSCCPREYDDMTCAHGVHNDIYKNISLFLSGLSTSGVVKKVHDFFSVSAGFNYDAACKRTKRTHPVSSGVGLIVPSTISHNSFITSATDIPRRDAALTTKSEPIRCGDILISSVAATRSTFSFVVDDLDNVYNSHTIFKITPISQALGTTQSMLLYFLLQQPMYYSLLEATPSRGIPRGRFIMPTICNLPFPDISETTETLGSIIKTVGVLINANTMREEALAEASRLFLPNN